jgi:hypothetical protein
LRCTRDSMAARKPSRSPGQYREVLWATTRVRVWRMYCSYWSRTLIMRLLASSAVRCGGLLPVFRDPSRSRDRAGRVLRRARRTPDEAAPHGRWERGDCHGGTGANAVPHARSRFTVTVSCSAGCVRISVSDEASLEERCPLAGSQDTGWTSWPQLSPRWATGQLPGGKAAWAELPSRQRDPCGSHLLPQEMQRSSTGQVERNQHSGSMGSGQRSHLICQFPDQPQAVAFLGGQRVR